MSQNPTLLTLGEFLKREREKSGLTLEQVASATKISIHTLRLIESDQYRDLPAKPFVRGFIISYSRFIGLDPKEILTRYSSFIEEKAQERPTRDSGHSGYAFERRETDNSRKILLATLSAFLIIGLVVVLVAKPKSRKKHHGLDEPASPSTIPTAPVATPTLSATAMVAVEPTATPAPSPAKPSTAVPAKPTEAPKPTELPKLTATPTPKPAAKPTATPPPPKPTAVPTSTPSPSNSGTTITPTPKPDPLDSGTNLTGAQIKFKTVFKAKKDLWIRYQSDDRPVRRIILRSGNVLVLRAEKAIKAEMSDDSAANVTSNGKTVLDPTPTNEGTTVNPKSFVFSNQSDPTGGKPFGSEDPLPRTSPPARPTSQQNNP